MVTGLTLKISAGDTAAWTKKHSDNAGKAECNSRCGDVAVAPKSQALQIPLKLNML